MDVMKKKGQLAIMVIVAIVIVAVLIFLFLNNKIGIIGGGEVFAPGNYLKSCIGSEVNDDIKLLASQGGYKNPEGIVQYQGEKVKYLCYTNEFYKTCVVQQPLIKENFEKELKSMLKEKVSSCVKDLQSEYERRGYSVSASKEGYEVSVEPKKVSVDFIVPMTVTKETSQTFRQFNIDISSEIYDLMMISTSIIDFESKYGDSETTTYIQYYPDLKIEKARIDDGSKIYKISNVVTKEEFVFASRSLVFPPGYGLG